MPAERVAQHLPEDVLAQELAERVVEVVLDGGGWEGERGRGGWGDEGEVGEVRGEERRRCERGRGHRVVPVEVLRGRREGVVRRCRSVQKRKAEGGKVSRQGTYRLEALALPSLADLRRYFLIPRRPLLRHGRLCLA